MKKFTLLVAILFAFNVQAADKKKKAEDQESVQTSGKSTNFYINPIGLLLGSANLSAEFAVLERFSLGPSLSYSKYSSGASKASSFGAGVRGTLYLGNPVFTDSWFLQSFLDYVSASNSNTSASASGIILGANVGYWWHWDGGFNLNLGLGAQYVSVNFNSIGLSSVSAILPSLGFSIGYAF